MHDIVENIVIMLLTIIVLIGGGYLALVLLNWGLKLKGGAREDEGLVDLWAEAQKMQHDSSHTGDSADDSKK